MSEWRKGPPTEPGWHWWKATPVCESVPIRVREVHHELSRGGYLKCLEVDCVLIGRSLSQSELSHGGWHHPLTPPAPPEEGT